MCDLVIIVPRLGFTSTNDFLRLVLSDNHKYGMIMENATPLEWREQDPTTTANHGGAPSPSPPGWHCQISRAHHVPLTSPPTCRAGMRHCTRSPPLCHVRASRWWRHTQPSQPGPAILWRVPHWRMPPTSFGGGAQPHQQREVHECGSGISTTMWICGANYMALTRIFWAVDWPHPTWPEDAISGGALARGVGTW
jgi:hypothetical protein